MTITRLAEVDFIDPEMDAHYAVHTTFDSLVSAPHCHDFYELFVMRAGAVWHHVNGAVVMVRAGALVFIRPDDTHYYRAVDDAPFELINLAFPRRVIDGLLVYLGDGFDGRALLRPALPPTVQLSAGELVAVAARLAALPRYPYGQKQAVRVALRVLLADLFARYWLRATTPPADGPDWLADLCVQMQDPAHFVEGVAAMQRIACKSPAHLSRTFQQVLHTTPTDFVNDLRLNYAANLLAHTDRPVLDVALAAGFGNLSYFYRLFRAAYGSPPAAFRRDQRRGLGV
jgi:AraC family cel operon transcriptional repressor